MANVPAPAVIVGLDSLTGLQTARILAARGIPVIGVASDPAHPSCRTRSCRRVVTAPAGGPGLVDTLVSLARDADATPVLLPCTDLSVLTLSRTRDVLRQHYRCVLPERSVIETLLDKAAFHEYATQEGLPVIEGCVLRSREDAERAAVALTYPCALKPAVKGERWQARTHAKVFKVATPAELLSRYDACGDWADAMIAQRWIDGPDEAHVTCNAYFDERSNAVVTYVSHKLRQWPLEGGVGSLSRGCRNDEVLAETVRVFRGLGHRGFAYLEMKFDPARGGYVIIEPNVGRPTGRSAAADASGIPLVYTAYCDALGLPLPESSPREEGNHGRPWIYLRQDVQAAVALWRKGRLTPRAWVRSLRGCRSDAMFSLSDPRPFFADLRKAVGKARRATGDRPAAAPTPAPAVPPVATSTVDLDVHGLVGIRLVNASEADVATVTRQLGPLQHPLSRDPEITIRFVDHLPTPGLRFVEFGRTAYNDDGFFILQSGKRKARVKLEIDPVRRRVEYTCQRGLHSVPLLLAFVTVLVQENGAVPLHASAFVHDGEGMLVTGWAKGGKTEALLAFSRHGAAYVGDEWILLSHDGRRMYGIPERIRLQEWHLRTLPHLRRRVPLSRRALFSGVRALDAVHRRMTASALGRRLPSGWIREALPALKRQMNAQFDPLRVFETRVEGHAASPRRIFLMSSHDDPGTMVERIEADEIARRMAASVEFERASLMAAYQAYTFAFPQARCRWIEDAAARHAALLRGALRGMDAYAVHHPYPCDLQELYETMHAVCEQESGEPRVTRARPVHAEGVLDVESA